jgi:hypothetical protein
MLRGGIIWDDRPAGLYALMTLADFATYRQETTNAD